MRRFLLLTLLLGTTSCFPDLPDRTLVDNLRVLAVNVDPATASLATWPPPVITVTALAVDPADEELDGATHTWSLDLPEGEDWEALAALLPEGPHDQSVEIDLGIFFEQREEQIEFIQAILPLRYRVETAEDHREAVKLVSFLMPDLAGDDDDSAGDDDDSADPGPPPPTEEELTNLNPSFTSITVGDTTWTSAAGELPGLDEPIWIGSIGEDGRVIEVGVEDDEPEEDLNLTLFRTAGCRNLKPDPEDSGPGEGGWGGMMGGFGSSDDPCGDEVHREPNRGTDDPDWTAREVAWRPLEGETSEGVRLWLVLQDAEGGQIWQELRPEDAP